MTRAWAQARWELGLLLRNGEQLLVIFVIPIALLIALQLIGAPTGVPAVITVSIMATCFTSLAIATGFERRSGALRYAASTPLSRTELLLGKCIATGLVALLSVLLVVVIATLLGWRAGSGWAPALLASALGAAAFGAAGFLLAGTFRAEAVLALANGLFVLLIVFGGVLIPVSSMPTAIGAVVSMVPSAALAQAVATSLAGHGVGWEPLAILGAWAVICATLARRYFRWD